MIHRYLVLAALWLCCGIHAGAQTCTTSKKINPLGVQISKAALREYKEFNGHRINENGFLWKFGSTESENELLHDPETGVADTSRSGCFAWRRVWEYWLTLDTYVPGESLSRHVILVPGLLKNPETTRKSTTIALHELFSKFKADDKDTDHALRQAAVRAALNDSPWSATFISYLMSQANMTNQQFNYSSAHWKYIKTAFEQPAGYAYKACDPRRTVPAVGDLLCHSRGDYLLKNFSQWRDAARNASASVTSHCDVVISVNTRAKRIELIGGNIMQSVARRTLKLNARNLVSSRYNPDRFVTINNGDCADDSCHYPNLNVQYWSVLLQLQ
jgi:hypothetical protein